MNTTNTTKRDTYFDFLRGVAIMLVVANHTKVHTDIHGLLGVINQVMNCAVSPAVPIFLAISGYFLSRKVMETRSDYFKFLRKQLPVVYLPCLFWSIFHFIIYVHGGHSPIKGIILFFICGLSVYYFIAGIMQCYVLLPFVRRIKRTGVIALLLIALIWIGCYTYVFYVQYGRPKSLLIYAAPFPNLLVWFALGCYLGQEGRTKYRALPIAIATITALLCSVGESHYINGLCGKANHDWKITAYIFDFFTILLAFSQKVRSLYRENRLTRLICRLGIASFAVYLMHLLVVKSLDNVPLICSYWVSRWAAVLLLTWLFVEILKKLIPARFWRYLGLR